MRLLTNLETDTQKLLRIILIGQPELAELLSEHDMRQVAQRITSRYHLDALGAAETDEYICHRLKVAGCPNRVFTKAASRKAFALTQGTPRLINILCDRALIGAYARNENEVSADIIKAAAKEALPAVKSQRAGGCLRRLLMMTLAALLLAIVFTYQSSWRDVFTQYWPIPGEWIQSKLAPEASSQNDPSQATSKQSEPVVAQSPPPEGSFDTSDLREPTQASSQTNQSPPDSTIDERLDNLIKQADTDFRLGIPSHPDN